MVILFTQDTVGLEEDKTINRPHRTALQLFGMQFNAQFIHLVVIHISLSFCVSNKIYIIHSVPQQ